VLTPLVTPTPAPTPAPTPDPTFTPTPSPSQTPDPTPSIWPTPSESPSAGEGGGDDILPELSTTPDFGSEGPLVCLTVNVGGDSAIRRVTVTGKNISGIIVTAHKIESIASGFPPLPVPVYQNIDVIPARFSLISDIQLEFDIPLESIGDQNITRKEVVLYVFQNGTWIPLPTYATGTKNGRALYRAGSAEFSLFAITINNTPFSQSQKSAFTISPETDIITGDHEEKPIVPALANPPVLPGIPHKSEPEQPAQPVFSGIMVISTTVISAVLIRYWWIRRQNPP
jgi:PGF-pre-PGF domain-containing protein